ncbi:LPS assembly lipoprotein LptE [Stratiformator vulcanicus]|uniref:LPS assembly lipoprotein LptE n=1 Tax=Stratiformator vulcanicus TaxID=2527980 RepID=UPI002877965F|nr:LPS assembly lipoprotein LptE [Stratiformator vulcanicus]
MRLFVVAASCCALLGCGYTIGNDFDPGVRTVAVPVFKSILFRREIEFRLTEAVQKEIQNRTPFRIAHQSTADTRLLGKVVEYQKQQGVTGLAGQQRGLPLVLSVEVVWEDQRDKRVIARSQVPIRPESVRLFSQGNFAIETGQSMRTAEQDAIDELATRIVDLMETPW